MKAITISVKRYGEISPILQKCLGHFCFRLIQYLAKILTYFGTISRFWQMFNATNGEVLNKQSNHLVTLITMQMAFTLWMSSNEWIGNPAKYKCSRNRSSGHLTQDVRPKSSGPTKVQISILPVSFAATTSNWT